MNEKIAIFGAGDLGREILVLIQQINQVHNCWKIEGFFDDNKSKKDMISSFPVLGGLDDLNEWNSPINIILAISEPEQKKSILNKICNPQVKYPVLVHPGVEMHDFQNIKIDQGSIICAGNIFTCDIAIGAHVLINLNCTI